MCRSPLLPAGWCRRRASNSDHHLCGLSTLASRARRPFARREEDANETSPPEISPSGRGRCRAAGRVADRKGADLSVASGPHHRRLSCWRFGDFHARLIGQWLSERLGQPFIIENRPGAGSNIGTEAVVRAPADGYTLLLAANAERNQRDALRKAQFQLHQRHRAGCRDCAWASSLGHASCPFQQERFRHYRLRQGKSGKA